MDTTVVAHFRDQWDHFRAGEVGGTVVMIVEYYSEPEGGPGNLSHPANFEIFNKNSYAVWCILDDKFFVIFKQSLSRLLFFNFLIFLHLYRRINYSCLGASASISSFSFAPKVVGGGGGKAQFLKQISVVYSLTLLTI